MERGLLENLQAMKRYKEIEHHSRTLSAALVDITDRFHRFVGTDLYLKTSRFLKAILYSNCSKRTLINKLG